MIKKETYLTNSLCFLNFRIQIEYGQHGIQFVSLNPSSEKGLQWSFVSNRQDLQLEATINEWLEAYCQKKVSAIQLPFDWSLIPKFTQQVLQAVAAIPFGFLSTYGKIAQLIGRKQSARAVGGACGRNPFLLFIPCHRVLDAKLELRGYSAGGIVVKEQLLIFEGSKT